MSNTSSVLPNFYLGINDSDFTITADSKPAIVINSLGQVTFPQNVDSVNQTIKAAFDKFLSENNFLQFFTNTTNASPYHIGIDNKSNFVISANSLPAIVIDPSGKVTFPQTTNVANTAQKVFFNAYLYNSVQKYYYSDERLVSREPIILDKIISNIGGHYNSSSGEFTAPVSGLYHFDVNLIASFGRYPAGSAIIYTWLQAGSQQYPQLCEIVAPNRLFSCSISKSILMNATDIAKVFGNIVHASYAGHPIDKGAVILGDPEIPYSSFSGYLMN